MYTYTSHLKDEEVHSIEGQVVGGVAIGIILFGQAGYAMPPGSVENATSFNYPVHYTAIDAASVESVVSPDLDPAVLSQLIEAGKYLQRQGCRAIIGACGFFGNYLPQVVAELDVPCFFSSLMQVPLILNALKPDQKVGVLTANGEVLNGAPVLKNCGIEDPSRVVISGAEVLPEMQKILAGEGHYNVYQLEQGLVQLARNLVEDDSQIGAMLLECTLFPTHGRAVQDAVRLPVYDFVTLIDWVYSAVVRRRFPGYI
jgi:hypothetical protein